MSTRRRRDRQTKGRGRWMTVTDAMSESKKK